MATEQDNNQADAQIQAHRHAHQQKMKKLFLGLGAMAVLALVLVLIVPLLNDTEPTKNLEDTDTNPLSVQEITAYRDAFKAALTDYELRLQATVSEMKVAAYAPASTAELSLLKETALTAFAQGAFNESKSALTELVSKTEQLIAQWERDFTQQLDEAQTYFEQENIPQAQLSLNKALAIMPNNLDGLALQSRIDAFSEIEFLLEDLKVAKIERNLPKQIDLLSDIIQLDPERNVLQTDLNDAKAEFTHKQLLSALSSAEKAIEANELPSAEQFIQAAKKIDASSEGAKALTARLTALRNAQSLSQILNNIETAAAQDNWALVDKLATTALNTYSTNQDLRVAQQQAQKIQQSSQQLQGYISRPERLSDNNIRDNAKQAMLDGFSLSLKSPALQAQIAALGDLLDSYDSPVEVTIESDNKTYIIVLGVGHVGQHLSKSINLTPGNYVLEGKREGYKNKRVPITVSANTPLVVTLVCDQTI